MKKSVNWDIRNPAIITNRAMKGTKAYMYFSVPIILAII